MSVYIAIGSVYLEFTENLGVFDDYEDALQRCRDRRISDGGMEFDAHWIDTWELGAAESVDVHEVTPTELVAKAAH